MGIFVLCIDNKPITAIMRESFRVGEDLMDFLIDEVYNKNCKIENAEQKGDVEIYKLSLNFDKPTTVFDVKIKWHKPMRGILQVWIPTKGRDRSAKQWFFKSHDKSMIYYGAPIISVFDKGRNFQTVALSDADTPIDLAFFVDDFVENDEVGFEATLFCDSPTEIIKYETYIRIDNSDMPYEESIKNASLWWGNFYKRVVENTEFAEYPLYSSWYNFHQHPNAELLEKELDIAKDLGFKTVILDDGWQYDGKGTGDYFDCGNWSVSKEKFPNFKKFVDKVHSVGMRIAVWFPVPFIGYNTEQYQQVKDMLLYNDEFYRAGIIDPRYPEIRKYLVELYKRFMVEYSLDGLKLDFINCFYATNGTPPNNERMDCKDLFFAVRKLLDEICVELKKIRPDLLLEFRQAYVGPSICSYCNMLRVHDCAFDSITNRIAVTDLRLPEYKLAVHSDMLYWSNKESLLNVKKQLLNVLFSVPQISVLLTESTPKQLELIKKHLEYWGNNKDVILHGKFTASNPDQNYSVISSEGKDKKIVVLHDSYSYSVTDKEVDLFNSGNREEIYVELFKNADIKIYGLCYNQIEKYDLPKGVHKLIIPICGMAKICIK